MIFDSSQKNLLSDHLLLKKIEKKSKKTCKIKVL